MHACMSVTCAKVHTCPIQVRFVCGFAEEQRTHGCMVVPLQGCSCRCGLGHTIWNLDAGGTGHLCPTNGTPTWETLTAP
jgi:hypothetical protein